MNKMADDSALIAETRLVESLSSFVYIESLFEDYLNDPQSVSPSWQATFAQLALKQQQPKKTIEQQFMLLGRNATRALPMPHHKVATAQDKKQVAVTQLVAAYRNRGHQKANLDPLGIAERAIPADLDLASHGLSLSDRDTIFQTGNLQIGKSEATLGEIVDVLEQVYCQSIGIEYMHIVDSNQKRWIQQRLEEARGQFGFSGEQRSAILERLTAAEGLEKYLGNKYVGAKRFGLEGAESFIPMVNEIVQRAGGAQTKEIVIGMAHRGRLNLLVNILGKNPSKLFDEFEGKITAQNGSGDVKYHQGFSCNVMTAGGEIHLALAFNPSHLEIVQPVVIGSVRARQVRRSNLGGGKVLPIIVHGDAAFSGQGVVMETFQMSQTRGYGVGGTIHIVINNQVGFTTSERADARSTEYCTDVAKMVQCPIIHVNGDDPDAVIFATQLAVDYRLQFEQDVVLDLFCYRRRGHNEADEPSVTQPLMYKAINSLPTTRTLYADALVKAQVLSRQAADAMVEDYRQALLTGQHVTKALVSEPNTQLFVNWAPYIGHAVVDDWDTAISADDVARLGAQLSVLPDGFVLQKQVEKTLNDRKLMWQGQLELNWGAAEIMAYASLVDQGLLVRITGQDVGRGTFTHRHAILNDYTTGKEYVPLQHLAGEQTAPFIIYNSLLSEEAVLGFEYGYATTIPNGLIVWEAQFGDFANGAQVVIDQFITSGETKWERVCGLTMLLPHGFEGQGPEHSSARLERFLQLCAEDNIQVCVPTTPAQIFHLLRRQAVRPLRKPLVVMTPKSLLRHKLAVSPLTALQSGKFETVLPEVDALDALAVKRIVLCTGKVYYDLLEKRREHNKQDTAIIRIEQLYPYPEEKLIAQLQQYPQAITVVWCQEEPRNQGAWWYIRSHIAETIDKTHPHIHKLEFTGRLVAAAPACGSLSKHTQQQTALIYAALQLPL